MDADRLGRTGVSSASANPDDMGIWVRWRWPDRSRGRWNFLTWPVFLVEILAAQQFLGSGARAAQDAPAAASTNVNPAPLFTSDGLPEIPDAQSPASDSGEKEAATNAKSPVFGAGNDEAGTSNTHVSKAGQDSTDGASPSGSGASSGSGGNGSAGPYLADFAPQTDASVPIAYDENLFPSNLNDILEQIAQNHLGDLLDHGALIDLGLAPGVLMHVNGSGEYVAAATLDQIAGLHLVENGVGVLGPQSTPIDGELSEITGLPAGTILDNSISLTAGTDPVESSVPSAASIVAADEETPLHDIGAVSSAGAISFPKLSLSSHVDELFADGRYTDYNLILQPDANPGMGGITNTSGTNAADALPQTAKATDVQPDQSPLSSEHDLDTSLVGLTSSDEELGIRDSAM